MDSYTWQGASITMWKLSQNFTSWQTFSLLMFPSQAFHDGKCIGVIVGKMGQHRNTFRGYIAMLVVVNQYRGKGIGEPHITTYFLTMLLWGLLFMQTSSLIQVCWLVYYFKLWLKHTDQVLPCYNSLRWFAWLRSHGAGDSLHSSYAWSWVWWGRIFPYSKDLILSCASCFI